MAQNIPITFTANPVPVGIRNLTVNQLMQMVAQYLVGSISANVSFFIQGTVPPPSNQGLFYNQTSQEFEDWNNAQGAYIPITSSATLGDMKASAVGGDDTARGWIVLDGRLLDNITGINQQQKSNLQTLYGTGATAQLPNYKFFGALNNLPDNGSFSGIANPQVAPLQGVIGALPFSATYVQTEPEALRDNTETLENSCNALQASIAASLAASEKLLNSLNASSSSTGPVWKVYIGAQ